VGYIEGTDPVLKRVLLISGHYDHIGLKEGVNGDFINNGANDDASGSTAVAEMAKYFSVSKSNKRSVLCLFVGRKGLLGSKHLKKAKTAKF
jgi:Zn-dependent M28 family amino/carboxypeptidase